MAYDLDLAERIREILASESEMTERKMFGGLAFLRAGHMAVVVGGQGGLMLRVEPETVDELIATTPARPAEMRGREMRGWLRVASSDVEDDEVLDGWVDRAVAFVMTLPPKKNRPGRG